MEIGVLSGFLAPFLPYLVQTGQDLGEEAARKLGAEGWGFAQRIWARLRPKVEEKPAAKEAAADAAAAGDDPRPIVALDMQLEKILAADAELAADIDRLLDEASKAGVTVVASGEGAVAIGGNATSSPIVTGNQNTIGG